MCFAPRKITSGNFRLNVTPFENGVISEVVHFRNNLASRPESPRYKNAGFVKMMYGIIESS